MVTPYLVFNGNCKEALDFYQTDKFGVAKVFISLGADYIL